MLGEQCVVRKKLPAVDYAQRRKFRTRRSVVALRFVAPESLDTRLRFWLNLLYIYRRKTREANGVRRSSHFLKISDGSVQFGGLGRDTANAFAWAFSLRV
jgi:hypothetical protein